MGIRRGRGLYFRKDALEVDLLEVERVLRLCPRAKGGLGKTRVREEVTGWMSQRLGL